MNIEYAKTPKWANAEKTQIDLIIKVSHLGMEVPFTANPDDIEEHGRQIFADCVDGKYGPIADYVPQIINPPTAEQNKFKAVEFLRDTDWVNQPDVTDIDIDPHLINHSEFMSYRSALRKIAIDPQPGNVIWPIKPKERWS
jgi:hypothetical protein